MPLAAPRILIGLAILLGGLRAQAGGGPANVLLVVNANSADSKRVANHYAWLRRIPASNVLYLDYRGSLDTLSALRFREELLRPILETISSRRLSQQIDAVAYSVDFPTRIDFTKSFPPEHKFSRASRPLASLTGSTYLFAYALSKSPALVSLRSNYCVPTPPGKKSHENLRSCRSTAGVPSRALRFRHAWRPNGSRSADPKGGVRYLMATMLGVTQGRGNTVEEVIACLDRSAEADFTHPEGTFYFMRRERAPRSVPRHACFEGVVEDLRALGADAQIQQGVVPKGTTEVAGLMVGSHELLIDPSKTRLLPGAIVEHLTSFGGVFRGPGSRGQTSLTDLIRAGASGTCGTVTEPLALQAKFPLPTLHLHYRRGCSLAESFYQSVAAPYQLLVVGDPLCQPWAERPTLRVDGWPAQDGISPTTTLTISEPQQDPRSFVKIRPRVGSDEEGNKAIWELYIDGRLRGRALSGQAVAITADKLGPGWHEMLLAGIAPGPIACQREMAGALEVLSPPDGHNRAVRLVASQSNYGLDAQITVEATAPGADRVVIRQHSREVAAIEGSEGRTTIDASLLGAGPVRLQAISEPSGAASPPLWVQVE